MSLAQEPGFTPKTPFRKKLSVDIPTRDEFAAKRYMDVLRDKFEKSNKKDKIEMYELMSETVMYMLHNSSQRNRKLFTKVEQLNFMKLAMLYQNLKIEFGRVLVAKYGREVLK